jgi:hypothetical protein
MSLRPDVHEPECHDVIIKNTFLMISNELPDAVPLRRASSEPPRLSRCTAEEADDNPMDHSASCPNRQRSGLSNASTALLKADIDATTSDTLNSEAELDLSEESSPSCDSSVQGGLGIELHLDDLVPNSPPRPKAKLCTRAIAFAPTIQPVVRPVVTDYSVDYLYPEAFDEFEAIVEAGIAALKNCECMLDADSSKSRLGWTVTGKMHAASGEKEEAAFAAAKQAILDTAKESERVYVVGYEAVPFSASPTKRGFTAQLAIVAEESTACWDLLCYGCCRRGNQCRWMHPKSKVALHFTAEDHQ